MSEINIEFIKVKKDLLVIEGNIYIKELNNISKLFVEALDGTRYYAYFFENNNRTNSYTENKQFFKISFPLNCYNKKIIFSIYTEENQIKYKSKLNFLKFVKLNDSFKGSYFEDNGYIITYTNNTFSIEKADFFIKIKSEILFCSFLIKKGMYKNFILRVAMFLLKYMNKKEIWLFMDRVDKAGDNAEAFYKYCIKKKDGIKKYFIISKESKDIEKIEGNIVNYKSYKHKILLILASKIISSHVDVPMREPFRGKGYILSNLADFKFVFLQHGIIKDDLSDWLNKYNKNIDIFVTSTYKEYESILNGSYGYTKENLKLTGLARYDYLKNKNSIKQILIMPTWRNSLVNPMNELGKIEYSPTFKESDYFKKYNSLINNEELISSCIKYGYKIVFMPHPNMKAQLNDFNIHDNVSILSEKNDYNKLLTESSLLITDYSSIAFDFAYMKKPVLYYQFDYDNVFADNKIHIYKKGYFNYKDMGLGNICYDEEELIKEITYILKNGCVMEKKYLDRVKRFFTYDDNKNCERLYNEIRNE